MRSGENDYDIKKLLSEADRLIDSVDSMIIEEIKDEHRIEFEKCCLTLKQSRNKIKDIMSENDEKVKTGSFSEGMHEAYQEIAKAMKDLKNILT